MAKKRLPRAVFETQKGAPAILFALPDEKAKENRYEIAIPKQASLYLTHSWDGEMKGLDQFEGKHPPVVPVFWAFRIMVGMGLLMLAFYGLACSLFPWLVIDRITIWQAATAPAAMGVILVGSAVVLPMIIGDTVFAYRVFWGKSAALKY